MSGENPIGVKPMPQLLDNTRLVNHVAYHHEAEVKEAARIWDKVCDARLRLEYIEEMLRRRQTAINHWHDKQEATKLWMDAIEKSKVLRAKYKDDLELKQVLERNRSPQRDPTILHILSSDFEIREQEPTY